MSVTEISGRASIGAIKKPWRMHLAIHSPLLVTCALHSRHDLARYNSPLDGKLRSSRFTGGNDLPPQAYSLRNDNGYKRVSDHGTEEVLTIAPSREIRYARRLPYLKENGCQKSKPQPRKRNMHPVP
jgi:hypothetical protein